jgi:hypothetical protein
MTTGLPWRAGPWFVEHVDLEQVLTEPERAEVRDAGDDWALRTTRGQVDGDQWAASWVLVAALRERYGVEHRSPLPSPKPVDLDEKSPVEPAPAIRRNPL